MLLFVTSELLQVWKQEDKVWKRVWKMVWKGMRIWRTGRFTPPRVSRSTTPPPPPPTPLHGYDCHSNNPFFLKNLSWSCFQTKKNSVWPYVRFICYDFNGGCFPLSPLHVNLNNLLNKNSGETNLLILQVDLLSLVLIRRSKLSHWLIFQMFNWPSWLIEGNLKL